jgi:hypothetical protein
VKHFASISWLPAALLAAAAGLAPERAAAQVPVYASLADDGIETGTAEVRGPTLVHVYFNGGTTAAAAGQECEPAGGGAEICQWAVGFSTTGNLVISDVAWNGSAVEDDEPTLPAVLRKGTGGDAVNGQLGPQKIATVSLSGTFGELRLETTPAGFGFVDRNGVAQPVATDPGEAAGVHVVARAPAQPWRDLSAHETNSCGVLGSGELRCWGSAASTPPAGSFAEVAATGIGGCAREFDHDVVCFGSLVAPLGVPYLRIVGGEGHVCGLTEGLDVD